MGFCPFCSKKNNIFLFVWEKITKFAGKLVLSMDANDQQMNLFTTRMRQMILQYKSILKENEELYAKVSAQEKEVDELKGQLAQAKRDYNSLMMAKMLEVTDGDIETAKKRVQKIIRDVNRCITLLSENS